MFTWENSHRCEFHTGMTFWFRIAFTWWWVISYLDYLKVHFRLIKYTCDSKSQTLRTRYPFQSTGRPISHWNGWSCRVYMIPLQNLVPESFNLFTFFQEDINQSKVVNSFQLSSDCINLYERMRINKKRSHFSAPCCKWTVVTY